MHLLTLSASLLLSCFSVTHSSQPYSKEFIATTCGGGKNLLCDLDRILNTTQSESLTSLLQKDLGSEGDCAKKIYVVIVRHLANASGQQIDTKMKEAAEYLRDEWRENCCTITVILLSTGDARVWTGFCEDSGLCEEFVKSIYKAKRHYLFDYNQYYLGLYKFIRTYQEEINDPLHCAKGLSGGVIYVIVFLSLVFLLIVCSIVFWCYGFCKRGGRGHHCGGGGFMSREFGGLVSCGGGAGGGG